MQPFTEHNINNNPPGLKARAWPTKKPTKHIRSVNTVKNARQDRNVVASNTNQKTAFSKYSKMLEKNQYTKVEKQNTIL